MDKQTAEYTPTVSQVRSFYGDTWDHYNDEPNSDRYVSARVEGFDRMIAEVERAAAERAWDEGGRHIYDEGGKCSFSRDGDPCPYNPYRVVSDVR